MAEEDVVHEYFSNSLLVFTKLIAQPPCNTLPMGTPPHATGGRERQRQGPPLSTDPPPRFSTANAN